MRRTPLLCLFVTLAAPFGAASAEAVSTTRITRALILDGSGATGREGSLRIVGDRIAAVAYAPEVLAPVPGETVVEARGRALAPGFIDTHTHGDEQIFEHPEALAAVSQGITTFVGGQDGDSILPLGDLFSRLE
ncbi:MAG: D-aminoacylase, partial [Thermoanaerobaculia bacterium]|nr:D-aminoacylase [Thermoanaerobaculia bacterium]